MTKANELNWRRYERAMISGDDRRHLGAFDILMPPFPSGKFQPASDVAVNVAVSGDMLRRHKQ